MKIKRSYFEIAEDEDSEELKNMLAHVLEYKICDDPLGKMRNEFYHIKTVKDPEEAKDLEKTANRIIDVINLIYICIVHQIADDIEHMMAWIYLNTQIKRQLFFDNGVITQEEGNEYGRKIAQKLRKCMAHIENNQGDRNV